MDRTVTDEYFASERTSAKEAELRGEGYSPYLDSLFLQRLKGVSFLGVLDYVYELTFPSNRYTHTVCVSHLALELARRLSFSRDMERAFVIANILHDVGHAPFSHNSEPFLIEQLNLYHQGLRSSFFMHSNRFAAKGASLAQLLDCENDIVAQTVRELMLQSRRAQQPLEELFQCPINCDKAEGNHRTLCHLDRDSIPPERLIGLFAVHNGEVFIRRADVDLVVEFWIKERDVYWRDIYTSAVFSGEAMLTRALEECFDGQTRAETFLFMTDSEALEEMISSEGARDLLHGVMANKLFASMQDTCPDVLKVFGPRLKEHRFAKAIRREIEQEIAAALGTTADRVISHFSRRKYFDSRFSVLQQLELFQSIVELVPLERVSSAFQNSKKSGDFFDVFYLPA